jgi:hypothetical protein
MRWKTKDLMIQSALFFASHAQSPPQKAIVWTIGVFVIQFLSGTSFCQQEAGQPRTARGIFEIHPRCRSGLWDTHRKISYFLTGSLFNPAGIFYNFFNNLISPETVFFCFQDP